MNVQSKTLEFELAQCSTARTSDQPVPSLSLDQTRLGQPQRYVVCAFYTPAYEIHVTQLKASLERLGLNYHLRQYPQRSTWEATTRLKPGFIVDCLQSFPDYDVLYVDADAVMRQEPKFFDTVTADVALLFAPVHHHSKHALSIAAGTLYVRNTPSGRRFANTWHDQQTRVGPTTRDEDMIYMAFPFLDGINFCALPRSYSKVFDSPGPAPVIEHFQASRKAFKLRRWLRRAARFTFAATLVVALSMLWNLIGSA